MSPQSHTSGEPKTADLIIYVKSLSFHGYETLSYSQIPPEQREEDSAAIVLGAF
jgi:hypothetical protein